MCGIAGICLTDPAQRVSKPLLTRMTRALAHRGPDGEGLLVDGNLGLGHRRLSIIDLAGGHQPIYNEDRSIAVVFNGEIYNYVELAQELERAGHRFATRSDTETIVHAFEEWGPRCVERFAGMFAFALVNKRERTVLLVRDRLGKKPLFYHYDDDRLIFASELKALLVDDDLPRELALDALDDYLAYGYVPSDRCILEGVHKLAPGHWLIWRDGRIVIQRYWDADFTPDDSASEEEWIERVEAELRTAVRIRLRSDVPLGVFLSGGVDSSAIVALAAQEQATPINTFSVGFDEREHDEADFARRVARHCGTNHHELVVRDGDIDVLSELAYHLDEPFADPSALPTYYVCRAARAHVTVALSGDGGDEVFAGYSRYLRALRYANVDWVPAGVRRAMGAALLAVAPTHLWGRGLIERVSSSGAQRYLAEMSSFSFADRRRLLAAHGDAACPGARRFERFFDDFGERDIVTTLQHCDQKNYLPDDILVKVDRMAMQVALEVRSPLLDHRVVDAVNAAPAELKIRDDRGKYLLRRIIQPHLPAEILARAKMGFGIPIKRWFRGALSDYARDLLLAPSSRAATYLDRDELQMTLDRHHAGMRDFSRRIWSFLMLEHWCRCYDF